MSGVKEFSDFDAFLAHDTRGAGRGGKTLKGDWKKQSQSGGKLLVYLHPRALPIALWQHNFPMRVSYKTKDGGHPVVAYWSRRITCHDPEEILSKQYFRNRDGSREYRPQNCPLCKLVEWVYQGVMSGELSYDQVIFDFNDATEAKNNSTIHAGPFARISPKTRFLPDYVEAAMKASRIRDAWSENGLPNARYVLTCVNVEAVKDGLQILAEGPSVGESIKKALKDRIHAIGDKGNFLKHPKPILITYDALTQDPKEKYRVTVMDADAAPMTPEIESVLQQPVPPLGAEYQPFDMELLRAQLETAAKISIPFDDFFGEPTQADTEEPYDDADEFPFGANAAEEPSAKTIPCDNCGKPMLETDAVCKHCGATYDMEDDIPPPPPVANPGRRVI